MARGFLSRTCDPQASRDSAALAHPISAKILTEVSGFASRFVRQFRGLGRGSLALVRPSFLMPSRRLQGYPFPNCSGGLAKTRGEMHGPVGTVPGCGVPGIRPPSPQGHGAGRRDSRSAADGRSTLHSSSRGCDPS
jgi:hypothetical protein